MCSGCRRCCRLQCILLLAALTRALDETGAGRSLLRFRPLLHAGFCSGGASTAAAAEEPGCPTSPRPPARGARMACYLVISSRHLSNGHYRGIKGVFRGPLCKKGARSPVTATSSLPPSLAPRTDYAEKEKAAAKALEDVKANFYCELCDKQYHKHQEFDNHINSYDHAHKQRLKDLKQREFARNVASKSWKDEKKQEKALKRLHQLAELRKQSECITGSGPLLKAPRLVMEKQQAPHGIFLYKGGKFTASSQRTMMSEGQGFSRAILEKQQLFISRHHPPTERHRALGNQVSQMFPDSTNTSQRAGVSFSFSKKVPLKLESSASVFSENSEEGNDCSESPNHKKKQAIEACHSGTLLEEHVKASLDKGSPITQDQIDVDNSTSSHAAPKPKIVKENDKSSDRELEEKVSAHPSFSKVKIQLSNLDFSGSLRETEQESKLNESEQFLETLISPSCQASNFCMQLNTYKHSNAHLPNQLSELPSQSAPELAHSSNNNSSPGVVKRERSLDISEITKGNMETRPKEAMVKGFKPQTLPFLHVLSKDGTTALQWPTELLLFTKTEPCISYGCNPLYFDFRLSLNHRNGKQHGTNKASCKEHSKNNTDENEPSGLIKHKQMSNEQDNQLLKPKKMKGSLNPRKAKQKAESDIVKEINKNGQKCIADYLNENIPEVPAYLDVSQKDYLTEKGLHTAALRRPLKHHLHSCERKNQNIRNESISFSAFMSRIKKSKAAKCHLIYSKEKCENQDDCGSIQDVASYSSDISDSGKDSSGSFLSCKSSSNSRNSENEGCGSYTRCWRFPSPQKSSSGRHSSYSDTSVSSTSSCMSYMSPTSNNHSRNYLLCCCKRKSKTDERHKCKHRKHKCIFTSDDTDDDYLCHSRSHRTRNCTQRGKIKYRKCSIHKVLQHRDRSKHSRCRHRHFGKAHSRSRSYHRSKSCSTSDSRSSERSSSSRISRGVSSGSFSKETDNYDNKTKEDAKRGPNAEPGKAETAHYKSLNVNSQSKNFATCSYESLAKDICGKRKSLTAKLLLERVQSKKAQEQMHNSERFSNSSGEELRDRSKSHFGLQFSSSVEDVAMLPLPEKALSIGKNDMGHNEISLLENSVKKNNLEASEITNVTLSPGTDYDHCVFKDVIQIETGYQSPSIKRNTAIKEQPNLFISEVQPFIQSCDPVPNDFPGAFPSNRYSVVANSTETKELHDINMDSNGAEGSSDSFCDNAMQKYDDTVDDLEVYSKSTSPPLTQQPITFSPEEVDKYRLLQLQAQQHMQKQLLAKHLKVLPAPGPAAFSATPAVPAFPVQQHATVTTIHHTLLQRFAVSASVHPHGSHLSLAPLHPLSQAHFAPISLSPLAPAFIPTHPALLTGHPLHLVSTTPLHPSPLTFPALPHAAYIPALFTPHLNTATASAIHPNHLVHPVFQGQEPHHYSCSSQTQQLPTTKEVFSVSSYLN
ncbi:zinc finger protein 804B isoform X1 [Neopelma chrysocephalum]|uniref:zinc finger protein 804B isoform X1 n=1 Tax=Neopelma chrysocephalum TaxID=114329 RepID=UPI000FCD4512|nr:zinc finger protein 804B isoform X1 [Neopelma chrysocephalum]